MTSKLDTKELDRIIDGIETKASQIVRTGAELVQAHAVMNISHQKLVDTSALMNGIKAEPEKPPYVWWVHDSVTYGIFWELGFHQMVWGRFQMLKLSQRPWMIPAVETVRPIWNKLWEGLFK